MNRSQRAPLGHRRGGGTPPLPLFCSRLALKKMPRVAPVRGIRQAIPTGRWKTREPGIARPGGDTRQQSVSPRVVLFWIRMNP